MSKSIDSVATAYNDAFFDDNVDGSLRSARAVVPVVLDLYPANSVVDFGCGLGTWLRAFRERGVETILGIDGSYVNRDRLLIGRDEFRPADLREPIRLEGRYDLATCLEVAEHLPARSAESLVASLTRAAPAVLFSAALPGQGGIRHINERWPAYWERLFARDGFRKHDVVRPLIWQDRSIEPWYRQNLYLFASEELARFEGYTRFEPEWMLVSGPTLARATGWWSGYVTRGVLAVSSLRHRLWNRPS